jgi:MFS family permease
VSEPVPTWREVLGLATFRRLWLGNSVSLLGDWFTFVAVGTLAVADGSLWAVAVVLLAHTLPRALLAPFAGRLADRVDRRALVVIFSLLRAVVVAAMIAAVYAGALGAVQVLLFVRMALGAFVDPAANASLPQLVPTAAIGPANALMGATWSVLFAVGVGLGGLVTAYVGTVGALAIDAATFVLAAGIFAALPRLPPGKAAHDRGRLIDAWALAWRERPILEVVLAKVPLALASGGAWIWLHGYAAGSSPRTDAGAAALTLGVLHALRGVGTGAGPLLWARIPGMHASLRGVHAATLTGLAAIALFAAVHATPVVLVAMVLWGVGVGANWVNGVTRMQTLTPNHALGRMAGIDLMLAAGGQCVGGLLGVAVAERLVAPAAAAWCGLVIAGAAWGLTGALVRAGRGEAKAR